MIVPSEVGFTELGGCKTCHLRNVKQMGKGPCPTKSAFGILNMCATDLTEQGVDLKSDQQVRVPEDTQNHVDALPYLQNMAKVCLGKMEPEFDRPAVAITRDLEGKLTAHVLDVQMNPVPLFS